MLTVTRGGQLIGYLADGHLDTAAALDWLAPRGITADPAAVKHRAEVAPRITGDGPERLEWTWIAADDCKAQERMVA